MRLLEICHLFDNLIFFNALVAVHIWVFSKIFIITIDDLVVNVLNVGPVSSLLLLLTLAEHTGRILEALDIIWKLKIPRTLSIKIAFLAVYIAARCFVSTYTISDWFRALFLTLIEKRFLNIATQTIILSGSHTARIKDSLILREMTLCGISTATIVAVSACTCTQLLLKSANLKTALFLVLSYKWMETSTIINIKLIDVNPSGSSLLTITNLRLCVEGIYIERATAWIRMASQRFVIGGL